MGEDLRLEGVSVDFAGEPGSGKQKRRVLDIPEFSLEAGDMAVLEGPSGTGKTTSLRLVSGILLPDKGSVRWNGLDIGSLPAAGRDAWRGRHIGWIYQDFCLFDSLNASTTCSFRGLSPISGFRGNCVPGQRNSLASSACAHGLMCAACHAGKSSA